MADAPREFEQGAFTLRYTLLPKGRVRLMYRFEGQLELGPVELDETDASELGSLIERIAMLVNRVYQHEQDELTAPDDDERGPLQTDPSALRRRREP